MRLGTRIVVPPTLALLLLASALVFDDANSYVADVLGSSAVAMVTIWAVTVLRHVIWPIERLARTARAIVPAPVARTVDLNGSRSELVEIDTALKTLSEQTATANAELETSRAQVRELGEEVRQLRENYVLAVEHASDGMWECDIRTGAMTFSPRWLGMVGHAERSLRTLSDWRELLHADDRETVAMRLQNHIDGLTPRFEAEYRIRRGDDRYVYVSSRGIVLRQGSGRAWRLTCVDNDVHARKTMEQTLVAAAEGLSSVSGMDFFRALVKNLAEILGTRDNMVCRCLDYPPTRVRALAYYSRGKFWEKPLEYDLAGTSCGDVLHRGETVYCPHGVCDIWPAEQEYDRDSYIGVPMFDSGGKIIGHFACMDGGPMHQDLPHLAIFKIFSVRAAAELERILLEERLGS